MRRVLTTLGGGLTRALRSALAARAARRGGDSRSPRRRRTERGVALLVVLSTLSLVGAVVAELQFDSRVDFQLAVNARDDVQAEYSALSAMRVRALLLKNGRQLDSALSGLASSFGLQASAMPPASQLLEMVPVDCSVLSAITVPASGGEDEEGGGMFPGTCSATSKSESGKISLTALTALSPATAQQAQMLLLGLLSDPKLERFFQKDDDSGDHAESPQELVGAIIDWEDQNKVEAGSQVGDEDRYYAYLKDPYRVKNAPFDSVAELQLVHGIGDELYSFLKDRVTIYNSSAQIELATADDLTVGLGICAVVQPGTCVVLLSDPRFWTALQLLRTGGGTGFAALTVQGLEGMLDTLGVPLAPAQPGAGASTGRGGQAARTALGQVFTDRGNSAYYTIDAEGSLGNAHSHLRAVYNTGDNTYYYYRSE